MERRTGKNKKGSLLDLIWIIGLLLFASIVILLGFKFMSELNTHIQANPDITADAKAASTELTNHYPTTIDNSFLLIMIFLAIGTFILAGLVRVHPIFIPIFIIALVFIIFLAAIFSNIYQKMAGSPALIAQANQLTVLTTVMTWLPLIVGILGTILVIVMYKSYQAAQ